MYQKTNIFLCCTMVSRAGENGKVLDIGRKMQYMGVQEWKITGFGKGVL
ncbi:hypothetical protein G5A81_08550 [Blautia wexlerae]|jgi:hypothetical protein|nr:hypothetical protein [Blautia wexlerae]